MNDANTIFVGLDVHKDAIAVAVAEPGRSQPRFVGTVENDLAQLIKALGRIAKPHQLAVVYEAGPCGYRLVRELRSRGIGCEVIAPSKTPRPTGDRIKTDRRDALLLARSARAGDLINVWVPDARDEAIRDLSRAREDALVARLKARQQLKAMLLRHGHSYTGKTAWTAAHERYLATFSFGDAAQDIAFNEYRQAVHDTHERLVRLTDALRHQVEDWRMKPVVEALQCLRGIDLISATTLLCELGDLRRFSHPRELMGFVGLVPSESTSGNTRRQGAITKTGNGHARRILVEAAWNYRYTAKVSWNLEQRQQQQPKAIRDIAWKAQLRLCQRYRRLQARHLQHNKLCVAIARELTGFVWDIARQMQPLD